MSNGNSSKSMDEKRHLQTAYEYLCHLEEAKKWIEHNLHIELPPSSELEEYLRNGIVLARLANFFAPELIPEKKIYDIDYTKFEKKGLHYKYTDNIISFIKSLAHIGFPKVFFPETTDIYDMKNMPKLIYCIHALSMYLYKLGKAHPIQDLLGKVEFSDAELLKIAESLKKYGVQMPAFSKIGGILASELSEDDAALHAAILLINEALDHNDINLLMERLKSVAAQLFGIKDEYIAEYCNEMKNKRDKKVILADQNAVDKKEEDVYDRLLTRNEIQECICDVNLNKVLVQLTQYARSKSEEKLIESLTSRDLSARGVLFDNRDLYLNYFHKYIKKQDKDYIFNLNTVNELISQGNSEAEIRKRVVNFVTALNSGINELTGDSLNKFIADYKVELPNYDPKLADSYSQWLQNCLEEKIKTTQDPSVGLWFDEVKSCINNCNKAYQEAKILLGNIEMLNQHVMSENEVNPDIVYEHLRDLKLGGTSEDCKQLYAEHISNSITGRNFVDWNGWTEHKLSCMTNKFCYNHPDKQFLWFKRPDIQQNHGYINKEQISTIVNDITAHHNNELYLIANSPSITLIQAFYLTHKVHLSYIQRPLIILLQSLFRTLSVMKMYKKVNNFNSDHTTEIKLLQQFSRIVNARQPLLRQYKLFRENTDKIIAIQSVMRANQAHRDYHNLVHSDNPSCNTVCRFVRLLDFDANDMKEEKELENLRSTVLKLIKAVNERESENREIDVRIGLLVKNKLKIQDVLKHSQGKSSKKLNEQFLPTITKDKQNLIDGLGTLFYILQINPDYTAHLILTFFGDRNSKFVKETCFALYNYGTYLRDEYTLIKMFSRAMVLEIETKIQTLQEFIKGDPLILKVVVNFYRNSKAQTWLGDIISSCVKDVINNKYSINTNPLDIYKQWISQIETETGQSSGYPYDVDTNTAMSYDEVKKRLSVNISNMKEVCTKFVDAIIGSASKIPYGLRYIARVLYDSLKKRFPDEVESSYHKIVGNLLYYRLINPGIVSPDTFNMVSSSEISAEKRKNLASISVVIQRSASHNFTVNTSTDNPMFSLNDYMASTWLKITNWFDECIKVDDLEVHFNIDEYTDQTAIVRPELNLTIGQIVEVHSLVRSYIEENNVPKEDPICVIMNEIGELPPPSELVEHRKSVDTVSEEQINDAILNTTITISLIAPKVEVNNDEIIKKRLFLDTIKYVVDLMNFEATDSLGRLLVKCFTPEQEQQFSAIQLTRYSTVNELKQVDDESKAAPKILTLVETQRTIIENTKKLESLGVINSSADYQSLILAVAKEIRDRRLYRKNRRFDLLRLRSALENLNTKDKYLTEQKECYQQYIQACVANLNTSKKSKPSKSKKVVKYNGAELYKQGVVLEVEGLAPPQFKNVQFEINSTDNPGVFSIAAKLYGVSMDSMQLIFEDLLQLQYENVSVIYMFDRAKVNVNLLIYIINKKFYSKK